MQGYAVGCSGDAGGGVGCRGYRGMQRVAGGCSWAKLAAAKLDWVKIKCTIHSRKSNIGMGKIKYLPLEIEFGR